MIRIRIGSLRSILGQDWAKEGGKEGGEERERGIKPCAHAHAQRSCICNSHPKYDYPSRSKKKKAPSQSATMHLPPTSLTLLALLSTLLIHLTVSLPTSDLPTHPIYSLPPMHPTAPLNGSSSSNGNCASTAKYPSWTSPDWVIEDCYSAVHQLYVREVLARPNTAYEFVAQGVSPRKAPLEALRTPRKYVVRKWSAAGWRKTFAQGLWIAQKLMRCRIMCADDHDAGMVPPGTAPRGCTVQQGRHGREHLSGHLECGEEYRDGVHRFQVAGLAYDR